MLLKKTNHQYFGLVFGKGRAKYMKCFHMKNVMAINTQILQF
jgi:hypothetical protein